MAIKIEQTLRLNDGTICEIWLEREKKLGQEQSGVRGSRLKTC